jgi:hypothetical protein
MLRPVHVIQHLVDVLLHHALHTLDLLLDGAHSIATAASALSLCH